MKGSLTAGLLTAAATLASAGPAPSPARLEARQTQTYDAATIPTVTVEGNAFWRGNERFYIRGITYQPGGSAGNADPLADPAVCGRDIPYFQRLGVNTIRVYMVDNSLNHDECMNQLAAAGIYLTLDVSTPLYSLNRADPAPSYNPTYLQHVFATMDVFSQYRNTLAFYNGNEVINDETNTRTAPYIKALGRDMKQYRESRGLRAIPIGYSAADVSSNIEQQALYFNCGTDDQRSDFFAINDYSWCSDTYPGSEWERKTELYRDYALPLFISEYGCVELERDMGEVAALMNEMTPVFSGGLLYEYTEEGNEWGIVEVSGDNVEEENDFGDLQRQLAANPAPTGDGGARRSPANPPANDCPAVSDSWALGDFPGALLPALPEGAARYFEEGAGPGAGLAGPGSQNAGGESDSTAEPGSASPTVFVERPEETGGPNPSQTAEGAAAIVRPGQMGYGAVVTVAVAMVGTLMGAALL